MGFDVFHQTSGSRFFFLANISVASDFLRLKFDPDSYVLDTFSVMNEQRHPLETSMRSSRTSMNRDSLKELERYVT